VRESLRRCLECIDVTWDGDYILCESAQKALALFYMRIDKAIASARALWDLEEEDSFDEDIAFELMLQRAAIESGLSPTAWGHKSATPSLMSGGAFFCRRTSNLIWPRKRDPSLLINYWALLKDGYRDRIIVLTKKQCTTAVDMNSPRESFVRLVKLLEILKSLGREREATKLIAQLLERYPTKRMLKEELKRAGMIG